MFYMFILFYFNESILLLIIFNLTIIFQILKNFLLIKFIFLRIISYIVIFCVYFYKYFYLYLVRLKIEVCSIVTNARPSSLM